jgi:hypothetical protein
MKKNKHTLSETVGCISLLLVLFALLALLIWACWPEPENIEQILRENDAGYLYQKYK